MSRKDRGDHTVPGRKKKIPDKKSPGDNDDEDETPTGSKDNKIDIRA